MITKNITFTDFNGNNHTQEHFFHLFERDLTKLQLTYKDGFQEHLTRMQAAEDYVGIYELLEDMVLSSYGIVADDGMGFAKDKDLTKSFSRSLAFDALMTELISDPEAQLAFAKGILPAGLAAKAEAAMSEMMPVA